MKVSQSVFGEERFAQGDIHVAFGGNSYGKPF